MDRKSYSANDRQEGGMHYKKMGVEPWDVVDTWPIEQQIGYYRGGALKYIMRMGTKDEARQEIRKAEHYIQKLLEVLGESHGHDTGSQGQESSTADTRKLQDLPLYADRGTIFQSGNPGYRR